MATRLSTRPSAQQLQLVPESRQVRCHLTRLMYPLNLRARKLFRKPCIFSCNRRFRCRRGAASRARRRNFSTATQLYKNSHLKRLAVSELESHPRSSEFDRPNVILLPVNNNFIFHCFRHTSTVTPI